MTSRLTEQVSTLLLTALWVAVATYADVLFKRSASLLSGSFAFGTLCYASTALAAFFVFRSQQWGWVVLVWNCMSLGLSLLLSVIVFREPMTLRRALSCVFVLAASLLAE